MSAEQPSVTRHWGWAIVLYFASQLPLLIVSARWLPKHPRTRDTMSR